METPVPQEDDDADTVLSVFDDTVVSAMRAGTCSDWPPEPPPPPLALANTAEITAEVAAEIDAPPPISEELDAVLAEGTAPPEGRRAGFYAIVRRPTTSSGDL